MQDAPRRESERACDQQAPEVAADHRPAMTGDVVPPHVPDRAEHAEKRQRDEQMNPRHAAITYAADEERGHGRHRHQPEIDEAQRAMVPRALVGQENLLRADRKRGQHGRHDLGFFVNVNLGWTFSGV